MPDKKNFNDSLFSTDPSAITYARYWFVDSGFTTAPASLTIKRAYGWCNNPPWRKNFKKTGSYTWFNLKERVRFSDLRDMVYLEDSGQIIGKRVTGSENA